MNDKERADALLEVVEQLYGWIANEFDAQPGKLVDYLGGSDEEVERWTAAVGPLALSVPAGYEEVDLW